MNVLLSQHDDEDEDEEDAQRAESHYQNVMAKPLFNTDEEEQDQEEDDEDAKRKGVHWGADVADNSRDNAP